MTDAQKTIRESTDKIRAETKVKRMDKPWKDADLVNHLYHEEKMSGPEIADLMDCSIKPIYSRIEDTRSISEANRIWKWKLPLNITTSKDGYERFKTKVHGEPQGFAHHRLLAVAKYGVNELKNKIVHHKNGIPWDNRQENLALMSQPDHVREHLEEIPPHDKAAMWAFNDIDEITAEDVASMFDTTRSTVTTVWKRINDGDYPIAEVNA